jgi:hypothetical protein
VGTEALAQAVVGHRFLAVLAHGHLQAVARVAVDRRIGGAAGHQRAHHDGQVLAVHVARGQLLDQRGLRLRAATTITRWCPCPGGGRCRRAAARQRRVAEQQRVDQRAAGLPAPGWTTSPAGLLITNVLVLEQHVQRDVLRLGAHFGVEHGSG